MRPVFVSRAHASTSPGLVAVIRPSGRITTATAAVPSGPTGNGEPSPSVKKADNSASSTTRSVAVAPRTAPAANPRTSIGNEPVGVLWLVATVTIAVDGTGLSRTAVGVIEGATLPAGSGTGTLSATIGGRPIAVLPGTSVVVAMHDADRPIPTS